MKLIRTYVYIGIVSIWGIGCLILLILKKINSREIFLTGVHLTLFDLLVILTIMLCIGAGSLLIRLRRYTARTAIKALTLLGWITIGGICLIGSCLAILNHGITSYYEFKSPDKQHQLVAEETTFLLLSSISLYERENSFFIRDLDHSILPDDGYPSITAGDYEITWDGSKVTLAVSLNDNGKWVSLTLDMGQRGTLIDERIYDPHETPEYTGEDTLSDTYGTDGADSLSNADDSEGYTFIGR